MSNEKKVQYIIDIIDNGKGKLDNINRAFDVMDKHSEKLKKMRGESPVFRQLDRDARAFKSGVLSAGKSVDMLKQQMSRLEAGRNAAFRTDHIAKYNKALQQTQKELDKIQKTQSGGGGESGGAMSMMKGMLGANAITGLASGGFEFGKQVIGDSVQTSAKYEKFRAVLKTTLGSGNAADGAMSDITNFASSTPFQVDELTDSFVKLANRGFRPAMNDMTKLGDLAASQGKGFDQLTEALLDAQTGEFERLKEFGVKAKTEGDKIIFNFKGQKTAVKNNEAAIRDYVLSLGAMSGVAGGMAEISKTQGGAMSNMEDNVDLLYKAIGDKLKPATTAYLGVASKVVGTMRKWLEIPIEEKLRNEKTHIEMLHAELTTSNTSEERRRDILKELQDINPDITKGINDQAINYDLLAQNVDKATEAIQRQISMEQINKRFASQYVDLSMLQADRSNATMDALDLVRKTDEILGTKISTSKMSDKQKLEQATWEIKRELQTRSGNGFTTAGSQIQSSGLGNQVANKLLEINTLDKQITGAKSNVAAVDRKKKAAMEALGLNAKSEGGPGSTPAGTTPAGITPTTSKDKNIDNVIAGGGKPTNINITIQKMQSAEEINLNNTQGESLRAMEKNMMDMLIRVINSANAAVN